MKQYFKYLLTLCLALIAIPMMADSNQRMLWGSINGADDASAKVYRSYNNTILLSWRMLQGDDEFTAFDLYRSADGGAEEKLNSEPITGKTNFQDASADRSKTNTYRLTMAGSSTTVGSYTMPAAQASAGLPYVQINLKDTKDVCDLDTVWYEANDASVGDLDGDGVPDIVIKRLLTHGVGDKIVEGTDAVDVPSNIFHTVLYEAYKLDGTFMWRICSGPNILLGNSSSFAIADFDGDGRCEMAIKTGEGTKFGDGTQIGDTDGDGITDYRGLGFTTQKIRHYIAAGPEFFSVVDGTTGRELARADFIARGTSEEWGDDYYKRASSLRVAVGNFSGGNPSVILGRGIYAKSVVEAWDFNGSALTRRWHFDSSAAGTGKDGKDNSLYGAQGFHSLSVGDVDGDGYDEVVYGSMTVDHDGQGLYTSEFGHGDALHLGKFDNSRQGLQIFSCQEFGKTMVVLRDAKTGATIWKKDGAEENDMGRALIADIDPNSPGCETWWFQSNVHSFSGNDLGYTATSCNMAIWFGSGLNRQLFNETSVHQQHDNTRIFSLNRYDVSRVNGTKGNPSWYGDILGDWREEIIMPDATRTKHLKVFTTWYPTDHEFPWLMTDHVYQMSALNQNVGYNMPTQTGFYLGSDLNGDFVEVMIGETGYATFGNTTGKHLRPESGIAAYEAKPQKNSKTGERYVELTRLEGIPQTAGVILKGKPNTIFKLYYALSGETYSASKNYLVRTTKDEVMQQHPDDSHWNFILSADDEGKAKFYLVKDGTTLSRGKAYLKADATFNPADVSATRGFGIDDGEGTTGITSAIRALDSNGEYYDLQGRQVNSPSGLKKGIYIVRSSHGKNGQKVIIK